ncbi:MAG: autotransporter domain-containing protein, partial [Janthinobacterium lividum]
AYAATDANAGKAPRIVAAAYSNKIAGATSTTLYVIDANNGVLSTQGSVNGTVSPNTGQLQTVGALGVRTSDIAGFNIARDGTVLASLTVPGTQKTSLYSVNVATGVATFIGTVGTAGHVYQGLAIVAPTIASYGITANQIAVGGALDNFVGVPSAALNTAFNGLDSLSAADRASALSQLTPSAYALLPDITLQTVEFTETTLRRYLRDFRAGGTGVAGAAGIAAPGDRKFGSFLVASGREGHYNAATDRAHVEYSAASVIGGIDYRFGAKSLLGVVGGYDTVKAKLGESTPDSTIRNYFGGGYGTLGIGPLYVEAFGTYGEANYDLRRGVNFAQTSLSFTAQTHSRTYFGGGTAGLSFNLAGFEFEPFVGARYAKLRLNGFTEGDSFGALTLGRTSYESVLGRAGLRIGAAFQVAGATVRPEIRGAYLHEFRDDDQRSFTFGFGGVGGNATALNFTPTALRHDYYTGGAGVTISSPTSPFSVVVDYNGQYDRDREIHGITGGFRLTF